VDEVFEPTPAAVAEARAAAAAELRAAGLARDSIDAALLVLSELMTNAIRHARTQMRVQVDAAGDFVRIDVTDRDSRPPALMGHDTHATSGRGLHIVAAVAATWGFEAVEEQPGVAGKRVWAEIRREP
jgi:anti-sigma regulatory factor (Ser/Thr protein kinase)